MDVSESGEKTNESALDQWLNRLSPKDLYPEIVNGGPDANQLPIKSAVKQRRKMICGFDPDVVIVIPLLIVWITVYLWLFDKFFIFIGFLRTGPH